MSRTIQFPTKTEYDTFVNAGNQIQVWNARNGRWVTVKDISSAYHPYNLFRLAPAGNDQEVIFEYKTWCGTKKLNHTIAVDMPLPKLKKQAKGYYGLASVPGVWVFNNSTYTYTFFPKNKNLNVTLSIKFIK